MPYKRLTRWHWLVIALSAMLLVLMLHITTKLMPSREKADFTLLMKTLELVQEIDPAAKNIYISQLVDKYLYPHGKRLESMEGVEAIAMEYTSPEFTQALKLLKAEREGYLRKIKCDQIIEIVSTIVVWFVFVVVINLGGIVIIKLGRWLMRLRTT